MASKKSKTKTPKIAKPKATEEKAITTDKDIHNEQLASTTEQPVNEPVPVEELEKELKEAEQKPVDKPETIINETASGTAANATVDNTRERAANVAKGPRMPHGITPRPLYTGNPYLPMQATVMEIIEETHNIRTLRLTLDDQNAMTSFVFEPGQVGQISVFGSGEATFVINSPPSEKHYLQFSVMRAGEVTEAIHKLSVADKVGLRAPLGNFFPWQQWRGKNVFFVGGGIGMAPIRTIMLHLLERKNDYGKISLLYGARSPKDMAYSYELDAWMHNPELDCTLCIDNPHDEWPHRVGLIPKVLEDINPNPENTVAVLCGPPIMIKFTLQTLTKLGFEPQNIVTTLEKRMKCGIGICGRCNIGDRYVCVDGPVFTMQELNGLPSDL